MSSVWLTLTIVALCMGALGYYAFVVLPNQLHRWRCQSLRAFARAVELRTQGRFGSADLLAPLVNEVALRMGLPLQERRRLELAVYLRDIGMVGIPYAVLNKPTPLTPIEQLTLDRHAELSASIAEQIPGLWQVAPLVRLHHVVYAEQPEAPLAAHILSALDNLLVCVQRGYTPEQWCEEAGARYHPQVVATVRAVCRERPLAESLPLHRSAALWL
ncbi:MAG: hypothetical protein N2045_00975 [Fimbriimonadales bacterium]|nr:hypothetical protein [Fimbriimonadales bacterium]CUU37378.1 hypothetical protein GXSOP10_13231 [Armatimonadetes bacterium GXS]